MGSTVEPRGKHEETPRHERGVSSHFKISATSAGKSQLEGVEVPTQKVR